VTDCLAGHSIWKRAREPETSKTGEDFFYFDLQPKINFLTALIGLAVIPPFRIEWLVGEPLSWRRVASPRGADEGGDACKGGVFRRYYLAVQKIN
jgi:hypothetical protein